MPATPALVLAQARQCPATRRPPPSEILDDRSCPRDPHCTSTPAACTTACHLRRSEEMNSVNSAGVIGDGTAPTSFRLFCTSGCSKIRFTSPASASTTGRGVPAGANRPCHEVASKPESVAATGGTSGAVALGCALVTARAPIVPAFTCGPASVLFCDERATGRPTNAFMTSPELRNGTCTILVPVLSWNNSAARCVDVPAPDEP